MNHQKYPRIRATFRFTPIAAAAPMAMLSLAMATTGVHAADPAPAVAAATPSEVDGASPQATLPVVTVRASREQETAAGPVTGFVAKRSATGTKTDTPISETPRSISVITKDQIEALRPVNMQDALSFTPGVFSSPIASTAANSTGGLMMRGMEAYDGDIFFQDGLRGKFRGWWGYSGYEPYAFERIEVLRGPASIMYGQGMPNGTVNMVTKRPLRTPLREVGLELGSFNHKKVTGDFTGPLNESGDVSYRITGLVRQSDTQIDHGEENRYFLASALAWRPNAKTELILRASFLRNEGEANGLPLQGTLLPSPLGKIPRNRAVSNDNDAQYDEKSIGWQFQHEFNDMWTVRSNLRVSQQTGHRKVTLMGSYTPATGDLERTSIHYRSLAGNYTVMTDNQLQGRFKHGVFEQTILLGVDYAKQKDGWRTPTDNPSGTLNLYNPVYTPGVFLPPGGERTTHDQQLGLYAQDQIKIAKQLVLNIGGRKDWAKSSAISGPVGSLSPEPTQKDDAFTGQAGIAYLFENGVTPYASYAESYVPILGKNDAGNLQPETGQQFELGLKYQPANANLLLTAAVFDLRRQNLTTPDPADTTPPINQVQTGEVGSSGLELEAKGKIGSGLDVIASYAHIRSKVTQSNDPAEVDKDVAQWPLNTASLWLDYELPAAIAPGLTVGAGLRYIGKTWTDRSNTQRVPGYTLVNLGARYDLSKASSDLKGLEAYLSIHNLTDKTYMSCTSGSCQYGIERSANVGLRYTW